MRRRYKSTVNDLNNLSWKLGDLSNELECLADDLNRVAGAHNIEAIKETGEKLLREIKDFMEASENPGKPLDPAVCKTLLERAMRDFQEALNGEDD